jgi:pterin-4a-carbinolamine dehydratase
MSRQSFAFISYRRSETMQSARGLHVQLRARFGGNRVFMDVAGIGAGDVWPERLRRELARATVLLLVIGPTWLTAADKYGRRRLDQVDDWVRREVCHAIDVNIPIIPLLVGGASSLPPAEGLPDDLKGFLSHQGFELRDDRWDDDVKSLCESLIEVYQFTELDRSVLMPDPRMEISALSDEEIDKSLVELPGWEPVESSLARDYPNSRFELRKAYRFSSFSNAIAFMQAAAEPIRKAKHHPRWENQWRTVIVYLSTWDIGNKISDLDVKLAHQLDHVYATFQK